MYYLETTELKTIGNSNPIGFKLNCYLISDVAFEKQKWDAIDIYVSNFPILLLKTKKSISFSTLSFEPFLILGFDGLGKVNYLNSINSEVYGNSFLREINIIGPSSTHFLIFKKDFIFSSGLANYLLQEESTFYDIQFELRSLESVICN